MAGPGHRRGGCRPGLVGPAPGRVGVAAAGAIEGTLLVVAVVRFVLGYRSARRTADGWLAAEAALGAVIPHRAAHVLLIEPRLLCCLFEWLRRGRPTGFSYTRAVAPVFAMCLALLVLEGGVVTAVLALSGVPWVWTWVALAAHGYLVIAFLGFWASNVVRPHVLDPDASRVRQGVLKEWVLPYSVIESARVEQQPLRYRDSDPRVRQVGIGFASAVTLVLRPGAQVRYNAAPLSAPDELRVTVDEPREFASALSKRLAVSGAGGGR